MFSWILNCLPCFTTQHSAQRLPDPEHCVFCNIREKCTTRIIYEDSDFFAFYDRSPCAKVHILVTPKEHYRDLRDLPENSDEALEMLDKMYLIGLHCLSLHGVSLGLPREFMEKAPEGTHPLQQTVLKSSPYTESIQKKNGEEERWIFPYPPKVPTPASFIQSSTDMYRIGWHLPPFNSVKHLHLHVVGLPFNSKRGGWKYGDNVVGEGFVTKWVNWWGDYNEVREKIRTGEGV